MSVFKDLVNIWKSENNLSQAWSESNDMLHLSHEMFKDAIEALRSGEKNKVLKSIKLRDEKINDYHREIRKKVVAYLNILKPWAHYAYPDSRKTIYTLAAESVPQMLFCRKTVCKKRTPRYQSLPG